MEKSKPMATVLTADRLAAWGADDEQCARFRAEFEGGMPMDEKSLCAYLSTNKAAISAMENAIVLAGGSGAVKVKQFRQSVDPPKWWRGRRAIDRAGYAEEMFRHLKQTLLLLESGERHAK